MKATLKFIGVLFYLNYFPRVFANYIYDDIANIASFLPSTGAVVPYTRPKLNGHKKFFITNGNPKFQKLMNERSLDSHFRVVKTAFTNPIMSTVNGEDMRSLQKFTVPANLHDIKIKETISPNTKHVKMSIDSLFSTDIKNFSAHTKKPTTDIFDESVYRNTDGKVYDRKDIYMASYADSQNIVSRQNQRPRNVPASKRSPGFAHKMQSKVKINKAIQKSTTNEENSPNMRRVNDKGKLTDKIQQKTGRKRDISANDDTDMNVEKNKYYTVLDNVITLKRTPVDQGLIAHTVDENTDFTNSPYAVFYRMSPDIIDQQDGYMVLNAQDERTNNLYTEREAAMNSDNKKENSKSNYRKYTNNGRIHGKVKNFSNFRNFK